VMPYSVYQLYQTERVKNDAERRQADAGLGRMAAAVSQFRGNVTRPVRALRPYRAERSPTCPRAEFESAAGQAKPQDARQLDQHPAHPGHLPKVGHLG
jgi:hypothetical protein